MSRHEIQDGKKLLLYNPFKVLWRLRSHEVFSLVVETKNGNFDTPILLHCVYSIYWELVGMSLGTFLTLVFVLGLGFPCLHLSFLTLFTAQ